MRDTRNYRSHRIKVIYHEYPPGQWRTGILVDWSEGGADIDRRLPIQTTSHSTREKAERHAFEEAKKWIDKRIKG